MASMMVAVSGCVVETELDAQISDSREVTRVLLCQQGLSDRTTGWDKNLFDLCEEAERADFLLVRDGSYPAFGALDQNGAYDALFEALDTNGDDRIDGRDAAASIHLVGFSWGGINATDIAARWGRDTRIASSRRVVTAMVLLDPFQPLVSRATIPANVLYTWEYRQTVTTEGDCSIGPSLGFGYNGHRPRATSDVTFCTHYDLDSFMHGIGHCDVPLAATRAALENLLQHRSFSQWDDYGESCPLD